MTSCKHCDAPIVGRAKSALFCCGDCSKAYWNAKEPQLRKMRKAPTIAPRPATD